MDDVKEKMLYFQKTGRTHRSVMKEIAWQLKRIADALEK